MVESMTPNTLLEALELRHNHRVTPLAGGTDLMVRKKSWSGVLPGFEYPALFIGGLAELKEIRQSGGVLTIGAAVSLSSILERREAPEVLKQAVSMMASPAIRNTGTLGGNICNASPAADTLPPLYALGASLVLQSNSGLRELPVADFIKGPSQTGLNNDELLVAVNVPLENYNISFYKKVGTRKADALSKVSFAGLARTSNGVLKDLRIALGAVAPRVVRSREAEELMIGKKVTDLVSLLPELQKIYARSIQPIDDQRSNAVYRNMVSIRLIEYFITQLK